MVMSWRHEGGVTRRASGPSSAIPNPSRSSWSAIAAGSSAIPERRYHAQSARP
jgi:hypothetical protein